MGRSAATLVEREKLASGAARRQDELLALAPIRAARRGRMTSRNEVARFGWSGADITQPALKRPESGIALHAVVDGTGNNRETGSDGDSRTAACRRCIGQLPGDCC